MNDAARRKILERRAAFIAAAIASVASPACARPDACLSAVPTEMKPAHDAGPSGSTDIPDAEAPAVCLSPPLPPHPSDAGPKVCLSKPRPCLDFVK